MSSTDSELIKPKKYNLTVKHIDIDNVSVINSDKVEEKTAGEQYTVTPASLTKYDYVESSDSLTGTINESKEITLKYRKKSKTINVKYVDENGREIKNPTSLTKKIDEEYTIDKPNIDTYTFKNVRDNKPLTGRITDNNEVVLVYSKN